MTSRECSRQSHRLKAQNIHRAYHGYVRMSNHQAGCRGPDGQAWDVPGLFIADASVLPGTIGVNPQVTIMALALLIGERMPNAAVARDRRQNADS